MAHTPGPWSVAIDPAFPEEPAIDAVVNGVTWHIALVHQVGDKVGSADANAELIALAPDHALLAAALSKGTARWHPFITPGQGEVVLDGIRYGTQLDTFGVPMLHASLRNALRGTIP